MRQSWGDCDRLVENMEVEWHSQGRVIFNASTDDSRWLGTVVHVSRIQCFTSHEQLWQDGRAVQGVWLKRKLACFSGSSHLGIQAWVQIPLLSLLLSRVSSIRNTNEVGANSFCSFCTAIIKSILESWPCWRWFLSYAWRLLEARCVIVWWFNLI